MSISPQGNSTDEIIADFDQQIKNIFINHTGYVRVLNNDTETRAILQKVCLTRFPSIVYSSKSIADSDKPEIQITDIDLNTFDDIKPSRENLGELIAQFLQENEMLGTLDTAIINNYLDNVIEV